MHELGIAMQLVEIACERHAGGRITRLVVEVGKLCAVLPDALRFAFDVAAEKTPLEGAALDIVETPGRARCVACNAELVLDRPFGRCACGGTELEWLAGEELRIVSMEVM